MFEKQLDLKNNNWLKKKIEDIRDKEVELAKAQLGANLELEKLDTQTAIDIQKLEAQTQKDLDKDFIETVKVLKDIG